MKQEVQWFLVEQLSQARALAGRPDIEERRAGIFAHYGGALEAFRYVEALSTNELLEWSRKMAVALGMATAEPPARAAQAVRVASTGPPPRLVLLEPSPFIRQVLGPDREFDYFGGRLRVLAVEIYRDVTVLRWRAAPLPDVGTAFPEEMAALEGDLEGLDDWAVEHLRQQAEGKLQVMRLYWFELEDDLGTAYTMRGSGHGGGGWNENQGNVQLAPAPPPGATHLKLLWSAGSIEIALV